MSRYLKEANFLNKTLFKTKINGIISEINDKFSNVQFKISPLVYKFKHKSSNEILYGMKVISNTSPNVVIRFNCNPSISQEIYSISCWRNYIPINRKYPTPEFVIDAYTEDQVLKESSFLIEEIGEWLRSKTKQSSFINSESIISIDGMDIVNMDIQKEINDIFNLKKDSSVKEEEFINSINDIKRSDESIVFIITDINSFEEGEEVISSIKKEIDIVSGISYFQKNISTDELAIALHLNNKKNNSYIVFDKFNQWDDSELMSMINTIVTEGQIVYSFKNKDLIPSEYEENELIQDDFKFIIITPNSEDDLKTKPYDFLKFKSNYEDLDMGENNTEIESKMNEILPNFLPKLSNNFKKSTIQYISSNIDSKVINITIPELAVLFEVKLVSKKSWQKYYDLLFSTLPTQ